MTYHLSRLDSLTEKKLSRYSNINRLILFMAIVALYVESRISRINTFYRQNVRYVKC
jgi:hypothetical protein